MTGMVAAIRRSRSSLELQRTAGQSAPHSRYSPGGPIGQRASTLVSFSTSDCALGTILEPSPAAALLCARRADQLSFDWHGRSRSANHPQSNVSS
jgi:hypothetical protein